MEATLYFDELTTEVIADGKHLSPELLRLAYKCKGPDRLALVTDAMRAVDMPDGEYWFGPKAPASASGRSTASASRWTAPPSPPARWEWTTASARCTATRMCRSRRQCGWRA